MRWELRARAVERGMTTSAQVRRRLAAAGLRISAGKMSAWWSTTPVSIRLDDLEVICAVLGCGPSDLLARQPTEPPTGPSAVWSTGVPLASPSGTVPAVGGASLPGPGLRRLVPPL
ncbi:helix-turn-helix domain-containing protein [Streptomyces sp. NPDC003710]